jgi:hypothetical protein
MLKKINSINRLAVLIPIFVVFIYNLIFFNRFYPITEGWFSTYAWLFNHGEFPYRDFYFLLPPLYLIKMSIFTTLFGYNFLYLRIAGIFVILLMTYFLYKNLQIIFGAAIAVFVAIVGIIYYQSGNAHITYDFTQFVILYGLIQSYLLLKYVSTSGSKIQAGVKWVFWAGIFAGLAFLTKQSNGIMITAFSFIGLSLLSLSKAKKEFLKILTAYIGGFIIPVSIISLWLLVNSAFVPFVQQIFSGAIGAKGGFSQIFFSWFKGILTYNFIFRVGQILQILLVLGYWMPLFISKKKRDGGISKVFILLASLLMLPVVILPLILNKNTVNVLSNFGWQGINIIIVAAISVPLTYILISFLLTIFKKPFNKKIFLFSFVALGFIYGTGASAGVTEVGAFFGFCLSVALMLHFRSIFGLGKIFIIFFCISFCLMLVKAKFERPYFWWNVTSPDIRSNLVTVKNMPLLRGIYMSQENANLIEQVTSEIDKGSKPGDPILVFPNTPIFYLIADRKPPGKAPVQWFDVLTDQMAIKEAEAIRKNPPKVIVYLDLGASVWEAHESLFRNGKPSGQREIVEAFMEVIKSKKMHISKKYELPNNVTLTVWRE